MPDLTGTDFEYFKVHHLLLAFIAICSAIDLMTGHFHSNSHTSWTMSIIISLISSTLIF